jgi:hypothetical protein
VDFAEGGHGRLGDALRAGDAGDVAVIGQRLAAGGLDTACAASRRMSLTMTLAPSAAKASA